MIRPLICCALLGACATNSPTPDVSVTPVSAHVVTSTGSGVANLSRSAETIGVPIPVSANPDTVFAALVAVYKDLGVATPLLDPARRLAGNELFRARRRLGGVPMQSYVDCGGSPSQPNAETYDIEMGLVSYVTPSTGGNATITTTLSAAGNDPMFGKDRQMRCASTGELERRIATMVRDRLKLK
jgi:hypothetical protein